MASATEKSSPPVDVEKETGVEETSSSKLPKEISSKLLKHSHDADTAMKAFEGMDGQVIELTEEKSKALLRKIDWHLMPVRHCSFIIGLDELTCVIDYVCSLWTKLPRQDHTQLCQCHGP